MITIIVGTLSDNWLKAEVIAQILAAALTLLAVGVAIFVANRERQTAATALQLAERDQQLRLAAVLGIESRLTKHHHDKVAVGETSYVPWELVVTNYGQHEARRVWLRDAVSEHWPEGQVLGSYGSIDGEGQSPVVDFLAPGQSVVMSRGQLIGDDATAYLRLDWTDGLGEHSELRSAPLDN